MNFLDLFSGIGGFSLGLERAGMKTIAFCEIESYPQKILFKHWPDVPIAQDIKKLSYNYKTKQLWYKTRVIYAGSIQLVCGGFPCQPFSVAGKQGGEKDDRHLWPEMFRLIREIKPKYVIGENVAGFISMALDDVLSDLESEDYKCEVFVLPACAVGGIHRRDRVWIIAHTERTTSRRGKNNSKCNRQERRSTETRSKGIQLENRSSHSSDAKPSCSALANSNNSERKGQREHCGKALQEQEAERCNEARVRESRGGG